MAINRERIEAILRVKDAQRFAAGMKAAAKSIKQLGEEGEKSAAKEEVLEHAMNKLEHESEELKVVIMSLSKSIDNLGDEMVQTAAKSQVMRQATSGTSSVSRIFGIRTSTLKDRLSLTRSEIMTTALTLGSYLAPALISVGSSAVAAALGGGAVAGGGLSTLVFGLGTLGIVAKQTFNQVKKIQTAQDAYNVTVNQFGARSNEAARSAAHLYGVIQTQGGMAVRQLQLQVQAFKKAWTDAMAPARRRLIGTFTAGLGFGRSLFPTMRNQARNMAGAVRPAVFNALDRIRPGAKATIETLGETFTKITPNLANAIAGMFIVIGRVVRASAPWVVKWSKAINSFVESLVTGTGDSKKLSKTIDNLVGHFLSWWRLAKALGTTLRLVFGGTKETGKSLVDSMTKLVTQFNTWLAATQKSGAFQRTLDRYMNSLRDIKNFIAEFFSNPQQAIDNAVNKYLPPLMNAIASGIASYAPHAVSLFWRTFWNLNSWGKFLTTVYILKKLGFFNAAFGALGKAVVAPFMEAFMAKFAISMGIASAEGGAMNAAAASAGGLLGTAFGVAFRVAAIVAIGYFLDKWIKDHVPALSQYSGKKGWGELWKDLKHDVGAGKRSPSAAQLYHRPQHRDRRLGHQTGGMISPGQIGIVGEMGPELVTAGMAGANVIPMGAVQTGTSQPLGIPSMSATDLLPPVHVHMHVDGREVSRAVVNYNDYRTARRGGRA